MMKESALKEIVCSVAGFGISTIEQAAAPINRVTKKRKFLNILLVGFEFQYLLVLIKLYKALARLLGPIIPSS